MALLFCSASRNGNSDSWIAPAVMEHTRRCEVGFPTHSKTANEWGTRLQYSQMPFSTEFWVGTAIAFVLASVGVAVGIAVDAKTKGEFRFVVGCFMTSAAIVVYGIGTWEMNTALAGKYRIPIALILFVGVAMGTIETVRWAHGRHLRAAELAKPPDGGRETVTLKDEVKVAVKPAPAIKTEVIRAGFINT